MTDNRIRVLWLIKGLGTGGAERLLHSAARVADHSRFAYETVYVLPWKSALVPDLEDAGVRTRCLEGARRLELGWPLRLRRLLIDEPFDVLHVHSPLVGGIARAVTLTVPADRRPAVFSTEHNLWSSYAIGTQLVNAALYWRDRVRWAVSEDVRRSIWKPFRDKVEVVVHGLVLEDVTRDERTRTALRRDLGIADDEVVVGTVANYRSQKAYPDLLRAARQVVQTNPGVRFVAVGQGPLETQIRQLHDELGLGERFLLLGERSDVLALLSTCDIFTLASLYEGFPVAVMEALAAGLPVVVTAVGGIPGVVQDGVQGRVVPPGNPDLLAERISQLASDEPMRQRMSEAARLAGQQFDIRRTVRQLEDRYAAIAVRPSGAPVRVGDDRAN